MAVKSLKKNQEKDVFVLKDITDKVARKCNFDRLQCLDVGMLIFEEIKKIMRDNKRVHIEEFGKFYTVTNNYPTSKGLFAGTDTKIAKPFLPKSSFDDCFRNSFRVINKEENNG